MYTRRGERKTSNNKRDPEPEMHFTIIQAESRDKVEIIIIFNNIFHFSGGEPLFRCLFGGTQCEPANAPRLIKIFGNGENVTAKVAKLFRIPFVDVKNCN